MNEKIDIIVITRSGCYVYWHVFWHRHIKAFACTDVVKQKAGDYVNKQVSYNFNHMVSRATIFY